MSGIKDLLQISVSVIPLKPMLSYRNTEKLIYYV